MKLLKLLVLIVAHACIIISAKAQSSTDSLFSKLNAKLANKESYVSHKQLAIKELKQRIGRSANTQQIYQLTNKLYDQYKSFNYDSAYSSAKRLKSLAINSLHNPALIASAKMKMGFTLLSSGLFKETLEELNSITLDNLSATEKVDYYFLKARSYFDLSDYNRSKDYSAIYDPKGISCIDSGLVLCKPGTLNYLELKGLKDLRTGNNADGEAVYVALLKMPTLTPHDFAVNACCLSYIYEMKSDQQKSLDLLIRAAAALQNTNWTNGLTGTNITLGTTYSFQPYTYLVLKKR